MDIKIVLRKKQNKDGTYPLALRITRDRKTSFIHLGYNLQEKDWDKDLQKVKKSYPNAVRLNHLLLLKKTEASEKALEVEAHSKATSSGALKQQIKHKAESTFFIQAGQYLDNLKAGGKYNQYTSDKPRIGHFKAFLKNQDIAFSDLTVGLLERYIIYLKSVHKGVKGKKPLSERSIMNYLVTIRSVFAHARKNRIVSKEQSPFGEGGIKIKFPDTNKVGISAEEVNRLEEVQLDDPRHNHARNLWLLSFYFAGMRVSDVLRLK